MNKRDFLGVKDFFSEDTVFNQAHATNCLCEICLESNRIFDEFSSFADDFTSEKVVSKESKKICELLDNDLLDTLNCGGGFENLLESYQKTWSQQIDGKPVSSLNCLHQENCDCIVCSVKQEVISKLDDLCSFKSFDDFDFEIMEHHFLQPSKQYAGKDEKSNSGLVSDKVPVTSDERTESYLVCQPHNPMILTVKNQEVVSLLNANTLEPIECKGTIKKDSLNNINLDELIDICLCEKDNISPYCLKHSINYCQHMQNKLYEEGCTCTRESECLFCQRLKCNYCSHERNAESLCPLLIDKETDDLTLKISALLDEKLSDAGVSPELFKQLSKPLSLGNEVQADEEVKQDVSSLADELAKDIDRKLLMQQAWEVKPIEGELVITDKMKEEILNMNELFDVRPFPRCYRLKGLKNKEGVYTGIQEEYMELGFEIWKIPTQFPEDIVPLTGQTLDIEARLEKEEDIRKKVRNHKLSTQCKKVKVLQLSDDWIPIVEVSSDATDYHDSYSVEDKEAWAQKTYDEIMDKCKVSREREEVNDIWSKVQPIMDRFGEEVLPPSWDQQDTRPPVDFEDIVKQGSELYEKISKNFQSCSTIGYKAEFWEGLEDLKPSKDENEVRKRLLDEVWKFANVLSTFKNDFERSLSDTPGMHINVEDSINYVLGCLPPEVSAKVEKLRQEIPEDWLKNPDFILNNLDRCSVQRNAIVVQPKGNFDEHEIDKVQTERKVSECDSAHLSDEYETDNTGKEETFFYDDEDQVEEEDREDDEKSTEVANENSMITGVRYLQPETIIEDQLIPSYKSSALDNFTHRPAPYIVKLKEKMIKNNPDGLHPIQKLWYDRPFYPFWTPSVVYDFSEIEKLFFDGVPEYVPDIDESKLKITQNDIEEAKPFKHEVRPKESDNISYNDDEAKPTDEMEPQKETKDDIIKKETQKDKKGGKKKLEKTTKRSATKSISDEACLLKEEDFNAALQQLLIEQSLQKEIAQEEEITGGGALSLDKIKKGVAGRVKSIREGAIELDSNKDFDLESILPCPALKYVFKLDIFQKQAIIALEAGLSVFVAAHTSAGKTVAAEYAIGMAMRDGCRVVYTSPIKALSNQKYNDFTKKFKEQMKVGIITGDVQLNKEAECLIMTTEILRSMLYSQSSILSDLEYVIFDEVHYFNDPERGNVWEEVLILLPHQCQLVMLSATVPDVMNFASWVGTLRKREVVVTTTLKRPVPLKHYIHFSTDHKNVSAVLPLREAEGPFQSENFEKAMRMKEALVSKQHKFVNMRAEQAKDWTIFILNHLKKHQRLPAVIFCFSRKRCDELASDILKRQVDLVEDAKKKIHIEHFFNQQINPLQEEDKDIQQIVTMKELLKQGIGVHHSGILPILKEIVEVLFSKSQIKLLFATETFAMGVNMPAKTVVFQQVEKYDGIENRPLKPGEYTQMAGRAGRRGIDKSGTVIITEWNRRLDKCITESDLKKMLTGTVDPLESQFRLRYSMILTALKPEGENSIQSIIQKSFFDFSLKARQTKTQEQTERVYDELKKITLDMRVIPPNLRDILCDYCNITYQLFYAHDHIRERMFEHKHFKKFLHIGRLVSVSYNRYVNVYGVILNLDQVSRTYDIAILKSSQCLIKSLKEKNPEASNEDVANWYRLVGFRKMELLPLNCVHMAQPQDGLDLIQCKAANILHLIKMPVFKINKNVAYSIIDTLKSPRRLFNQHVEVLIQFLYDAVHNVQTLVYLDENDIYFNQPVLRADVINYHKLGRAFDENLFQVSLSPLANYPLLEYLEKCYWFLEKQRAIDRRKVQSQKEKLNSLFIDFDSKLEFLKKNKFIKEDDDVVDTKGRIASRMTNFEVFVTEILLKNVLEDLDGAETASLLSCLVIPGVNTEIKDSSNKINPLFKPIEDTTENYDIQIDPSKFTGNKGMIDLKKTINSLQKNETEKKAVEALNCLIIDYLDLPPALEKAIDIVNEIRVQLIRQEDELEIEPMEGSDLSKITFYLVPIVYAWAKGKPMQEIMKVLVSNIQEGILVRWIVNLNETIKEIDSATHHFLKDSRIKEKFETASNSIKRGIIDTPSLYLNQTTQIT